MPRKTMFFALLFVTGCSGGGSHTMNGAGTGALIGGGLGLLAGGCHPLAATAIGAGAGTLVGGALGAHEDRREDRRTAQAIAAANAQSARQMSLDEIVQLTQRGTPDDIIMQQVSSTGSVFNLTTNDITYLQDQRVSSRVISYMQQHRPRTVIVHPQREVIYVPPPPPPPPHVGFGVTVVR